MRSVFSKKPNQGDCEACAESCANDFLLSPTSDSHKSPIFSVADGGRDECILLRAFNLLQGQSVNLEMIAGVGPGQIDSPAIVSGNRMRLDSSNTMLRINDAGRYRVVALNSDGSPVDTGEDMPTVELIRMKD